MRNLLNKLTQFVVQKSRVNFRDRRGHYPSGVLSCLRDQVWAMRGEKETNPSDFHGNLKMMIGSAVEDQMMRAWFSKMGVIDIHLLGTQVPVGSSNPAWNGYLDALVAIKQQSGSWENVVLEVKCAFGYGANLMVEKFEPKDSYLAQIGLYLKDLHNKGITKKGILVIVPISDKQIGNIVFIHCEYLPEEDEVLAYKGEDVYGNLKELNHRFKIKILEDRMKIVDKHLAEGTTPDPEFHYKYPLTSERLESMSDTDMRAAIKGEKVIGDWQVKYSRYKNKQIEADGLELGYTEDELSVLRKEYRRRHPRSKI